MRLTKVALLCALAVTLPALSLAAQTQAKNPRRGFWAGAGLGAGSERLSCGICQGDRDTDLSGYVKLGWTVSQHVLLGVESNGWKQETNGINELLGTLHAVVYWYPAVASGFYVKAVAGMLAFRVEGGGSEMTGDAFSAQVGMGYDLRITRAFSFTPFLNVIASTQGDLTLNGNKAASDVNYSLIQAGFGLTLH